ncbi:MAG: hypothetical protein ACI841_005486 [Planctomycetota bacterium]|jgi:hypothetical protein
MSANRNTPRAQGQGRVVHRIVLPELTGRRRSSNAAASKPKVLPKVPPILPEPTPEPVPAPIAAAPGPKVSLDSLDLGKLEEDLIAKAIARMRGQISESNGSDPRRIDNLERRLSKISGMLDERDKLIKTLMRRKGAEGDSGVSSIYSGIQGVDPGDGQADAKKAMMSSLFEANLSLQGKKPS